MAIREVQLFDDSVKSRTIAADTIVAADVDETAEYNFSSTSSTWAGVVSDVQAGVVNNVVAGSTAVTFPREFSSVPYVVITPVTTSTSAWQFSVANTSTAGFTIYSDTAGTIAWIAARR